MSHRGMARGRVVFKEKDLKRNGLSAEDVQDLMTQVHGYNRLSRLIDGFFTFSFCCQSFREFLTASSVAGRDLAEFSRINDENLHVGRWSVIRRFVTGIVFSKPQNEFHRVPDPEKKQEILSRSILSQLEKAKDNFVRMDLYSAIFESDNDDLSKQLSAIDVSDIDLSRDKAHAIGTLINRIGRLKYLDLSFCNIDDDILSTITKCLEGQVQIDHLDMQENKFSAEAFGSFLGIRADESRHLDWKVIRLTRALPKSSPSAEPFMSRHIKLTKTDHLIKIDDGKNQFKGRFHIKESKFAFDEVYWLARLVYFSKLFVPKSVQIPDDLLYVTQDDLRQVSGTSIKKMSELLLDCTLEENIDWSLIRESVEKYQVAFLSIAVDGKISTGEYEDILRHRNEISGFDVHVDIQWVFYISNDFDIQSVLDAGQAKKVGSLRCEIEFCAPLGDINRLVKASKKLTLAYGYEKHMLNEAKMRGVKKIARGLGAELEILCNQKCDRDAWWVLDSKRH